MAARKAAAAAEAAAAEAAKNNVAEAEQRDSEVVNTNSDKVVVPDGGDGFAADMRNKVVGAKPLSGTQVVVVENCVQIESLSQIGVLDVKEEAVKEMELSGTQMVVENCVKIETLGQIRALDDKEEVKEMELSGTQNSVKIESLSQIRVLDDKEDVKELKLSGTKQMEKPLLKDFISDRDDSARTRKKKPSIFCSRSLIYGRGTKMPSSPAKPVPPRRVENENNATPISKKLATYLVDKRKLTPKSNHNKSTNFTPVREFNRITSSIMKRIDNSKPSKDCCPTPLRTPLKASILGEKKHPLATPQSDNRRARTPIHPLASGSKTVRPKWHFLPTDCSKFMSGCINKSQSQIYQHHSALGQKKEQQEERNWKRNSMPIGRKKCKCNQHSRKRQKQTLKNYAKTSASRLGHS